MRKELVHSLILAIAFLSGCSVFQKGEPAVGTDAPAPPDYDPAFVVESQDYHERQDMRLRAQMSRLDMTDPGSINVQMHPIYADSVFLTDFPADRWCVVRNYYTGDTVDFTPTVKQVYNRETLDIAIVMDHSGSMGDSRARTVQRAVAEFVKSKRPQDRVALVSYDNRIVTDSELSTDSESLLARIKHDGLTRFGGMTAVHDAIGQAMQLLQSDQSDNRKVVIVFTDGLDNSSVASPDSIIGLAQSYNIPVCAADFGYNVDTASLQTIAARTGGVYHHLYYTNEFSKVFDDVYFRLNNYYEFTFNPVTYGKQTLVLDVCDKLGGVVMTDTVHFDNTPQPGVVVLLPVLFELNSSNVDRRSRKIVERVYAILSAQPDLKIEIRGHTDASNRSGKEDYNMVLSRKRAESVKEILVDLGIDQQRITAAGFGATRPVADNLTAENRAKNRRTEFVLLRD